MRNVALKEKLTPKQKEVVDYQGNELLVKGIAGSGKTTVLLRRARKLIESEKHTKIAIFTYNKTLAKYVREVAKMLKTDRVKVYTFHQWAYGQLKQLNVWKYTASEKQKEGLFKDVLKQLAYKRDHRFYKSDEYLMFLMDEISWIKGKRIKNKEEYEEVDRSGRGSKVRVTKADRKEIYKLYEAYQIALEKAEKIDFDDYGVILFENRNSLKKINHILIDEAQDLQQVQLEVLKTVAQESIVIAADKGQKIYKTSFSWKDIGINVKGGRTKILKNSFRSTKQIIQLAKSLQEHDSICKNKDDEFIEAEIPDTDGVEPVHYNCKNEQVYMKTVITTVKELIAEDPSSTIALLGRTWKTVFDMDRELKRHGIFGELIKRNEGNALTPGVKLTTFHSVKGLEFDNVIILAVNDGEIPLPESGDGNEEEYMDKERRLMYVSMTRAKFMLFLTSYSSPSHFFKEMSQHYYRKEDC